MIPVLIDGSLRPYIDRLFHPSFHLTAYDSTQALRQQLCHHEVLVCRATLPVNEALLVDSTIRCVATATSGTDHVDRLYLQKQHIALLDAKGANASSVADYVVACVAYCQIHHAWQGAQIGIIGVGAVGSRVQARLQSLGFDVVGYDPVRAEKEASFRSATLETLLQSDMLCIHAALHDGPAFPSRHLLSDDLLANLQTGTVILNAARGEIVDEKALLNAHQTLYYYTDVYAHEPMISPEIVAYATVCTPHIAGHSIEARRATITTVVEKLHHHYGLAMRFPSEDSKPIVTNVPEGATWQQLVLAVYNPGAETRELKQSRLLAETFLTLRQAHRERHDFSKYQLQPKHRLFESAFGR